MEKFNQLSHIPKSPGVYLMKDGAGKVLYIGKAKVLRDRVRQYFTPGQDERGMIPFLVEKIDSIETFVTPGEREALLLEKSLIQKHKPKYNVLLKDDKSYLVLEVDKKHPFPHLRLVRLPDATPKALMIGPFTSGKAARGLLEITRKSFKLRSCSDEEFARRKRPCILYEMGKCLAPCLQKCTKERYDKELEESLAFLQGKEQALKMRLEEEIEKCSEALEFEKASEAFSTLKAIQELDHNRPKSGSSSDLSIDIFHLAPLGERALVIKLLFRQGSVRGVEQTRLPLGGALAEELFENYLLQHYSLESTPLPDEVLLQQSFPSLAFLSELIAATRGKSPKFLEPKKGAKKELLDWAQKQSFHKLSEGEKEKEALLGELQEKLKLENYPNLIHCLDISHMGHKGRVGVSIAFEGGRAQKSQYRRYSLKSDGNLGDPTALAEVLERHLLSIESPPDLFLIDGGPLQYSAASKALEKLSRIGIDLIAITKEEGRHDKGLVKEKLCTPHGELFLPKDSPLLFFLQSIRDEAHRFAITYQKKRRKLELIQSEIDKVPGIGPKKKQKLFKVFGHLSAIKAASFDELKERGGLSAKDAKALLDYFKK